MGVLPEPVRILIIDDNPEDRAAYMRVLSAAPDLDCAFLEAESGAQGLSIYGEHCPDCTLLDYLLPETDGLEVLGEIARLAGRRPAPVVMLTAHGDEQIAVEAMRAGALDYMVKAHETLPEMPRTVHRALREWSHIVEKRAAEDALKRMNEELEREVDRRTAALVEANTRMAEEISERERAEEELSRHLNHLEDLVNQRTRELQDMQHSLLRQERLATIGRLTATVNHELRNPLGTMATSVHALRRYLPANDQRSMRVMERIDKSITRCTRIVDDLLSYTRRGDTVFGPVNADRWLASVLEDLGSREGIDLVVDLNADAEVSVDEERLRQAVLNVVENAVQSMQGSASGASRLGVSSRVEGDRVVFRVADSGPGIPTHDLPMIFEPLFSTRAFGIGLGLPLVRDIMDEHRGGVDVERSGPDGTLMKLWVPRIPGNDAR